MPTYVFKGRNRLNEIVVGERVAADRATLEALLRREQVNRLVRFLVHGEKYRILMKRRNQLVFRTMHDPLVAYALPRAIFH